MKPKFNKNYNPWGIQSPFLFGDIDHDKRKDNIDCEPFNPFKQHIRPNKDTQKRLEKLNIHFSSGRGESEMTKSRTLYNIKGEKRVNGKWVKVKKVPKAVKKAQTRFLSIVKKRPDVVGEIERKNPTGILFTSRGGEGMQGWARENVAVVKLVGYKGNRYDKVDIEEGAGTVHHELEHVRQHKAWQGKPKLEKRMSEGKYSKRPEEVKAREAAERAEQKRYDMGDIPYQFNSRYNTDVAKGPDTEWYLRSIGKRRTYQERQKRFFEGYRKMVDDEE